MLDTLLIISIGELGTHLLEAVARSGLFRRIVVGSRSQHKALERINCCRIGAGVEGYFPVLEAIELDFNHAASVRTLKSLDPDVVFSAPSLMPWWKISEPSSGAVPFGGYISLQLAPMVMLRERLANAGLSALWIGASFPDVINPVLHRTGFGPICGIGNVQEPIAKIQYGVASRCAVDPADVNVRLVAQHAFEYYVMRQQIDPELPPHLLEVQVDGVDFTSLGQDVLRESFPFPYDLHFNRVTASAGVMALRALAAPVATKTHLPGINGLVGGYPVTVDDKSITLDLAEHWSVEQAIAVNEESLRWDGIESVADDGNVVFSDNTAAALKQLLGQETLSVDPESAMTQAQKILASLA